MFRSKFTIQGINNEVQRLSQKICKIESKFKLQMYDPSITNETKEELKTIINDKIRFIEENIILLIDERQKLIDHNYNR